MSITSLLAQSYYNTYDSDLYYANTPVDNAAVAGALIFVFVLGFLAIVVTYVITAILLSRIFKKAGVEGWKAWVPVYNSWTLLELGDQKGFWAIIALIPVVSIVAAIFMIIAMYHIGIKLGKDGVFVLLAIFLPLVWFIWLAVDNSTWKGSPKTARKVAHAASNSSQQ
jgi:hypothetical protein